MRTGCLFVFGKMVAQACYGLGAMIATILITSVSFVLITVIGPLWMGFTREVVVRALRITHRGHPVESGLQMGNRTMYAALSGLVWATGFFVLRATWRLAGWAGDALAARLAPNLRSWMPLTLIGLLVFIVGTIVGAMVHRRDHGFVAGW